MKSRQDKLNSAFDQLLQTIPKKPFLKLKNSYHANISSTESSDNLESPFSARRDSIFLFSTPPSVESNALFRTPSLFSEKLKVKTKDNKSAFGKTKNCKKKDEVKKVKLTEKKKRTTARKPKPVGKTKSDQVQESSNSSEFTKSGTARKKRALMVKDPNCFAYEPSTKTGKFVQKVNQKAFLQERINSSTIPFAKCSSNQHLIDSVDESLNKRNSVLTKNLCNENCLSEFNSQKSLSREKIPDAKYSAREELNDENFNQINVGVTKHSRDEKCPSDIDSPETVIDGSIASKKECISNSPAIHKPQVPLESSCSVFSPSFANIQCKKNRLSQEFRKSRLILNSSLKFLAQLNKRKHGCSPQIVPRDCTINTIDLADESLSNSNVALTRSSYDENCLSVSKNSYETCLSDFEFQETVIPGDMDSAQYITSTPVIRKPQVALKITRSAFSSSFATHTIQSKKSPLNQDFRKSRHILKASRNFLGKLNKRKRGSSPQVNPRNCAINNITFRKKRKVCILNNSAVQLKNNNNVNISYKCSSLDDSLPLTSSDKDLSKAIIPNYTNDQNLVQRFLLDNLAMEKLALQCRVNLSPLSMSDLVQLGADKENLIHSVIGNKTARLSFKIADSLPERSSLLEKTVIVDPTVSIEENHNSSSCKNYTKRMRRGRRKSKIIVTPPRDLKSKSKDTNSLRKSLSSKLKQITLPFIADQSPIPIVPRTLMKCSFSPNNGKIRRRKKSCSNSDNSSVGSSESLNTSTGKLRQTTLDVFLSSGSEFLGFRDSELDPKKSMSPEDLSSSHLDMKSCSSNVVTKKRRSSLPICAESHTRSMIDCFLDLSVAGTGSRKKAVADCDSGVQTSLTEPIIWPHLTNWDPKVELTRLDDTLFKAALLGTLTARTKVMCLCSQTDPVTFNSLLPKKVLSTAKKIGEGSYGEVFSMTQLNGTNVAVKIIPIEGDQEVNGGPQMSFKDVLSEVILSKKLNDLSQGEDYQTSNFISLHSVSCVTGKYPKKLLSEWKKFEDLRGTENDNPSIFQSDQLYIIFQFSFGGIDLEILQIRNEAEAESIFSQVACSLAAAEGALEFEHRDLHWGNILVSPTSQVTAEYVIKGQPVNVKSSGVSVALIDFTLSRMTCDGATVYSDLSKDPTIFLGKGDIQFDVYREMKKHTKDHWEGFHPSTNVLWLEYLINKLLGKLSFPKNRLRNCGLKKWLRVLRRCKSATDFVVQEICVNMYI